ncbi:zinc ABC transporter substrate-binding protein [Magnetospira thiophila]
MRVVVTLKPLQGLVASVMEGVGTPHVLIAGGASPHSYSLKPSDAEVLARADVLFWIGPHMERFLEKPLRSLADGAQVVALAETPGLTLLPFTEAAAEGEDEHESEHVHEHAHDHAPGTMDMHVWLDPLNADVMGQRIAATLAEADPAHAETYRQNATALSGRLAALRTAIDSQLQEVRGRPFIVYHNAYRYFQNRFGLKAAGAIAMSSHALPGARHVAEIQDKIRALGAVCVFSEPQFEPKLVHRLLSGTSARAGVLDPLGASLNEGPDLYFELMQGMAESFRTCLAADESGHR